MVTIPIWFWLLSGFTSSMITAVLASEHWRRVFRYYFNRVFHRKQYQAFKKVVMEQENDGWRLNVSVEHQQFVRIITEETVKLWRDSGAHNFLQFEIVDPVTFEEYTMVIKKAGRFEPEFIAGVCKEALQRIMAQPHNAEIIASDVLEQLDHEDN